MSRLVGLIAAALAIAVPAWLSGPARGGEPGEGHPRLSARESEALDIIVSISASDLVEEKVRLVRRLADYRYPGVAAALVQMAEDESLAVPLARELEWCMVAMGELVLDPLAASLADDMVPRDLALLVLSRLARRQPELLLRLLLHPHPAVGRLGALALAASGKEEGLALLVQSFEQACPGVREAILAGACHASTATCRALVSRALCSGDDATRMAALNSAALLGDPALALECLPLLHSRNPAIVAASLETLATLGAAGAERDLDILYDSSPPDVQDQIVRIMGATQSAGAAAFLRKVIGIRSVRTDQGRLALRLLRDGAGRTVVHAAVHGAAPVEAVLFPMAGGIAALVLYASEGYRVVSSGTLVARCPGQRWIERAVSPTDFEPDGSLPVPLRCSGGRLPDAEWTGRDGQRLRGVPEDPGEY